MQFCHHEGIGRLGTQILGVLLLQLPGLKVQSGLPRHHGDLIDIAHLPAVIPAVPADLAAIDCDTVELGGSLIGGNHIGQGIIPRPDREGEAVVLVAPADAVEPQLPQVPLPVVDGLSGDIVPHPVQGPGGILRPGTTQQLHHLRPGQLLLKPAVRIGDGGADLRSISVLHPLDVKAAVGLAVKGVLR